ncbi:hypothetical protein ACSQ67_008621 [Phaseolus vulgaris]
MSTPNPNEPAKTIHNSLQNINSCVKIPKQKPATVLMTTKTITTQKIVMPHLRAKPCKCHKPNRAHLSLSTDISILESLEWIARRPKWCKGWRHVVSDHGYFMPVWLLQYRLHDTHSFECKLALKLHSASFFPSPDTFICRINVFNLTHLQPAPQGINAVCERFPLLKLVTSEIDDSLNENSHVIPGLGEFADRYFATDD